MAKYKNTIIRYLLLACSNNYIAHHECDWCNEDKKFYAKKEHYYNNALSLIKSQRNTGIQYYMSKDGHYNIVYFEWFDDHIKEKCQVSFHKPYGKNKVSGHTEIVWNGIIGGDDSTAKKLWSYYFKKGKYDHKGDFGNYFAR